MGWVGVNQKIKDYRFLIDGQPSPDILKTLSAWTFIHSRDYKSRVNHCEINIMAHTALYPVK